MSFTLVSVVIDKGSTNCPVDAPLRLSVAYQCSAEKTVWEAVYVADVASANWRVPVFALTPAIATLSSSASSSPSPSSLRVCVDTEARLMGENDQSSPLLKHARSVDDEEGVPSIFTTQQSYKGDTPQPLLQEVDITVDSMATLFSDIPEKYLLQVGLLQLRCYDAASIAASSPVKRLGEVNIVSQMKRASLHGVGVSTSTGGETAPPLPANSSTPLSTLTRCFYSPTA